jgi:tRNA 2-thiouridine synthesizing protein A
LRAVGSDHGSVRMPDTLLDTRGLRCPLPVLRARKAMQGVAVGEVLRVLATDPGTVRDFQAFCQATGHEPDTRAGRKVYSTVRTAEPNSQDLRRPSLPRLGISRRS